MILWLAVAAMTALAAVGIVWPLWRQHDPQKSGSDVVVYRDQLDEIARDRALGLIGAAEADAARIEVSRRLLAAAEQKGDERPSRAPRLRRQLVFAASLAAITLGAGTLYLRLGTPSMAFEASRSASASAAVAGDSVEQLVTQAENYLTHNPRDARAWEVLAPVYMRIGRYSDAANAWRNVIQLSGESADRVANLGEALVAEANGVVTAAAKSAFMRATELDPKSVSGRYYLGLSAEQDGRRDEAAKIFRALVADAPPGAHWVAQVRDAIARLEGSQVKPLPGPTPAQMLEAAKQPSGDQQTMIRGMVARLAARLKQDGSDPDSWARLVRSYSVLGEPDQARAAAADARKALAADPAKLARLESALKIDGAAAAETPSAPAAGAVSQPDIKAMVARLAARLKQDGSDPDGWAQLVRSYSVLGEPDQARAAAADARKALAADPAKLAKLEGALKADAAGAAPAANAAPAAPPASMPQHDLGDMVARLAARLRQSGADPEGWLMLTRSYVALGQKDKAAGAIRDARQALAGDPDKLAQFDESIMRFKLEDQLRR